jgi:hypothetical protein
MSLVVFWVVMLCGFVCGYQYFGGTYRIHLQWRRKMRAVCFSKTLVTTCRATWHHNPEDYNQSSLYCSQKLAVGPCPKQAEFSPHPHTVISNTHFNIILPSISRCHKWSLSSRNCIIIGENLASRVKNKPWWKLNPFDYFGHLKIKYFIISESQYPAMNVPTGMMRCCFLCWTFSVLQEIYSKLPFSRERTKLQLEFKLKHIQLMKFKVEITEIKQKCLCLEQVRGMSSLLQLSS